MIGIEFDRHHEALRSPYLSTSNSGKQTCRIYTFYVALHCML
jgi:hypothetical protein